MIFGTSWYAGTIGDGSGSESWCLDRILRLWWWKKKRLKYIAANNLDVNPRTQAKASKQPAVYDAARGGILFTLVSNDFMKLAQNTPLLAVSSIDRVVDTQLWKPRDTSRARVLYHGKNRWYHTSWLYITHPQCYHTYMYDNSLIACGLRRYFVYDWRMIPGTYIIANRWYHTPWLSHPVLSHPSMGGKYPRAHTSISALFSCEF